MSAELHARRSGTQYSGTQASNFKLQVTSPLSNLLSPFGNPGPADAPQASGSRQRDAVHPGPLYVCINSLTGAQAQSRASTQRNDVPGRNTNSVQIIIYAHRVRAHARTPSPSDERDQRHWLAAVSAKSDANDIRTPLQVGANVGLDNIALGLGLGTGTSRRTVDLEIFRPERRAAPVAMAISTRVRVRLRLGSLRLA